VYSCFGNGQAITIQSVKIIGVCQMMKQAQAQSASMPRASPKTTKSVHAAFEGAIGLPRRRWRWSDLWSSLAIGAAAVVVVVGAVVFRGLMFEARLRVASVSAPVVADETVLYRPDGSGRYQKLLIGPQGTRLVGTFDKDDVPLLADGAAAIGEKRGLTATKRFEAIGAAFR
jgi:hypothetical protein